MDEEIVLSDECSRYKLVKYDILCMLTIFQRWCHNMFLVFAPIGCLLLAGHTAIK